MKKTLLLLSAAFGLNVAIAQTTDNNAATSGQTPGINSNTPNQKAPGTQTVTSGSRNSDGSSNSSAIHQSGSKKTSGKNNSNGTKNPNGTNTPGANNTSDPTPTATPKKEQ